MSARVCAVCRATLGQAHLPICTLGRGSVVLDSQCITQAHESAILWVMLRLHQLEAAGLIVRENQAKPGSLYMTPKGVLHATEYFTKNQKPGREAIVASCAWLFKSKMPVSDMTAAALTTLILDEGTNRAGQDKQV